jgi:hypothetical protein
MGREKWVMAAAMEVEMEDSELMSPRRQWRAGFVLLARGLGRRSCALTLQPCASCGVSYDANSSVMIRSESCT